MAQEFYDFHARIYSDSVAGASIRYLETLESGRKVESDPVPLQEGLSSPLMVEFQNRFNSALLAQNAALVAERDQLAIDAASVPTLQARIAELEAELDAINNPPGPDTSTVAGAKQWLAAERYKKETGGITIGTQLVTTERDEIGHWFPRFYDASRWLQNDPTVRAMNPDGLYPYKPKGADSVFLTAEQVIRAYLCIAWYVNQCFAVEGQIEAMLNGGAPIESTLNGIVWPQNTFDWTA